MWDFPTMIVTLDAKRRLIIPAKVAPARPGDQFDAVFDAEEDAVILRRVPRKKSWLEVLKSCPVPMDDVPLRSRELPKKVKL
jgi:bifunctional DNA-binding transcriptional regulator/antitoxin component of YhaV-PrlF toxin-antitoxin module